jgi:hypothetical protein
MPAGATARPNDTRTATRAAARPTKTNDAAVSSPGATSRPPASRDDRSTQGEDPDRSTNDAATAKRDVATDPHAENASTRDDAGPGAGRTSEQLPPAALNPSTGTRTDTTAAAAPAAGGGETTTANAGGNSTAQNRANVTPTSHAPRPPWQSSTWPADRDAALNDIARDRIPDRYRDLVRDYFDR